jgi:hypothetical protein
MFSNTLELLKDKEFYLNLKQLKNKILWENHNQIVEKLIDVIDGNTIIEFKSAKNKTDIKIESPVFVLKLEENDDEIKKLYPSLSNFIEEKLRHEFLHREILSNLLENFVNDEEYNKFMSRIMFDINKVDDNTYYLTIIE